MQTLPRIAHPLAGVDRRDSAVSVGEKPNLAGGDRFDSIYAEEGGAEIDERRGEADADVREGPDIEGSNLDGKNSVHEQKERLSPLLLVDRDSGSSVGEVSEERESRAIAGLEPVPLATELRPEDANLDGSEQVAGSGNSRNQDGSSEKAEWEGEALGRPEFDIQPQVTGAMESPENLLDRAKTPATAPSEPSEVFPKSGMETPKPTPIGAYSGDPLLSLEQPEIGGVEKVVVMGGNASGARLAGIGGGILDVSESPALLTLGADGEITTDRRTVEIPGTLLNGGAQETPMAVVPAQENMNSRGGAGGTEQDVKPMAGNLTIPYSSKATPWQLSFAPVASNETEGPLPTTKGQDPFAFALGQPAVPFRRGQGPIPGLREPQTLGAYSTQPQTPIFVIGSLAHDAALGENFATVSDISAAPVSNAFAASSEVGVTARATPQMSNNSVLVLRQVTDAMVAANDKNIELTLDPPELGRVRVSMSEQNGVLTVAIESDQASTQNLIRKNQDLLRQDLLALGYSGISFAFDQGRQDNGKDNSREFNALNQEFAPETDDKNALQYRQILVASGVDIRV